MHQHIGKLIQEKLKEPAMPTAKDFAAGIGITYRTLYNVFKGDSDLTMNQVLKASEILSFDFFGEYIKNTDRGFLSEPQAKYNVAPKMIVLTLAVKGTMQNMEMFPDFLKEVSLIANKHGFKIG